MKPRIRVLWSPWERAWYVGRILSADGNWHNVASSTSIDYVYNKVVRQ